MADLDFIFMLTRNDRTVADAAAHLDTALGCGVRHIGFKDVGLPFDDLAALTQRIRSAGGKAYLEVVSLDPAAEIASIASGIRLGVDCLLGGVNVEAALPLVAGSGIAYLPFAGTVHGHPSILTGTPEDIAASAAALTRHDAVSGIDLLAWRHDGDAPKLIAAAVRAARKPVIVAGSIERPEQIAALAAAGAAGFTVGTAALDGRFPARSSALADQLTEILRSARR